MGKLEEIRQIYHDRGTVTGRLMADNGCVCILGAVAMACGLSEDRLQDMGEDGIYDELNGILESDRELNKLYQAAVEWYGNDSYDLSTIVYRYNDYYMGDQAKLDELVSKAIALRDSEE